jgi:hypothetical protein
MELATILFVLALLLHLAIAVVLIRKYLRTHDVGLINRIAHHESVGFYPFSLVTSGQITIGELVLCLGLFGQLVGVCLLFVAVLCLANSKNHLQTQS